MAVVALISDLMTQSQVAAAAARAGAALKLVGTVEALVLEIAARPPRLLVVDLGHPGLDPQALAARLGALLPADCTTLAFGPHVHKGRLAAAVEAGFHRVVSRGQFFAELDALLSPYAA